MTVTNLQPGCTYYSQWYSVCGSTTFVKPSGLVRWGPSFFFTDAAQHTVQYVR